MKAAWYEQQGPADKVLQVGEVPIPAIGPKEVLVRVHASGVNPSDTKRREGTRENMPYPRIIPHSDGAGIIEKIGEGVSSNRVEQRVWLYNAQWQRPCGTAAEYCVLPENLAIPLPDKTPFDAAACLGIPAMTAHRAVFADGAVKDKTILVTGGAGSVGRYAVQMAKWGGAKVIATVSNAEKAELAKSAGADYILNYREENVAEKIKTITHNEGVDRIVDVDFGGNLKTSQEILKLNGVIASYASMGNTRPEFPFYSLMFKGVTIQLVMVYELFAAARQQAINDINTMLAAGFLKHHVSDQFSLADIVAAHKLVESGKASGHVVLKVK